MALENISLIPFKNSLVPIIAKNFPDSFSATSAMDSIVWNPAIVYETRPGIVPGVLLPLEGRWTYKNAVEQYLPNLVSGNWITFNSSEGIYHLTYADKGLDHSSVNAVTSNKGVWVSTIVTDSSLYIMLLPFYKGLGIPKSEMDQLYSLQNNKSGSDSANALLIQVGSTALEVVAVVASGYSAYTALSTPVVSTPAVAVPLSTSPAISTLAIAPDVSYLGAGTITSSITEGSLAGSIATGAPLTETGIASIAGSVEAGGVGASIGGGITGTELLSAPVISSGLSYPALSEGSNLLSQAENLAKAGALAEAKNLINKALTPAPTPIQQPAPMLGTGLMILGIGLLAFFAIES